MQPVVALAHTMVKLAMMSHVVVVAAGVRRLMQPVAIALIQLTMMIHVVWLMQPVALATKISRPTTRWCRCTPSTNWTWRGKLKHGKRANARAKKWLWEMIMMPMVRMMMLLVGADAAEQVYGDIDDYVDFYDDAIRGVVGFVQSK